ncbi:MAG: ester cyclase [Thaumarchaeota archaeon]|nr:ester cyclase [Nitrososphaerota archaeon]
MDKTRSEKNKVLLRRFYYEVIGDGNISLIDEFFAPNFVDHSFAPGKDAGLDDVKRAFIAFRKAFPDTRVTVEDMLAEGDKVVARFTWRGTHRGEFMGLAPTGKKVAMNVIDIIRISKGKVVERWGAEDNLSLMQQLGVVSPTGE